MAIAGEQLNVTELDFQTIKANLVNFFKNSDNGFTDWDFEGSNLNTIIDLLAYNTHYNAMLAHMAVNESFIDSAQIRANVISAAKLLGYVPRSYSAASVEFDARFLAAPNSPDTIDLTKGTTFMTRYEDKNYSFVILEDVIEMVKEGAYYVTKDDNKIIAYEGRLVTTTLEANAADVNHRYVINDPQIDISTLKVRVFPTPKKTRGSGVIFQRFPSLGINIDGNSNIYFLNENSFGLYEIQFGNNIYGRGLGSGNVIELQYLVTNGEAANGATTTFSLISNIPYVQSAELIVTDNRVSGGAGKESINRLRQNAQGSFITQNRACTADDYKNLISSNFQYAQSISVWGGEDNDPPYYGKIFVCVKPYGDYEYPILKQKDKDDIINFLQGKKILALKPEMTDPRYVNIVLDVLFKYDSNLISVPITTLQQEIRENVIKNWNDNVINSFDTIFRHSAFTREVDNYARSILNSLVRVFVEQTTQIKSIYAFDRFIQNNLPGEDDDLNVTNLVGDVTAEFGVPCIDDDGKALMGYTTKNPTTLIEEQWTHEGTNIYLADEPTSDPDIYNLYTYKILGANSTERLRNVGEIDLPNGRITLNNTVYSDEDLQFTFTLKPKSNDIVGKRDLLLQIDEKRCVVKGSVDEITAGGSSQSVKYKTFDRDR